MIVDLPDTTTSKISKALVRIREDGGAVALGRVLTLIIATALGEEEEAIEAANDASREHPMRVIVVTSSPAGTSSPGAGTLTAGRVAVGDARTPPLGADGTSVPLGSSVPGIDFSNAANAPQHSGSREARLDAEIRVGGDAGASEVIVLRAYGDAATDEESLVMGLLLPDTPVATWWPGAAPERPSESPLGRIASRRITDASRQAEPQEALRVRRDNYAPGDTDFAWTRLTIWRAQLAAVLDQPPYESVESVDVAGASDSPSTTLLAAWLKLALGGEVNYSLAQDDSSGLHGIHGVALTRASGRIELVRDQPGVATLRQPSQPVHTLALPRRNLRDCLADELRRLDPDDLYGRVITTGLDVIGEPDFDPHPDTTPPTIDEGSTP